MCCCGSPDCSARRTSVQLEKYLHFHGITGILYLDKNQFTWFFLTSFETWMGSQMVLTHNICCMCYFGAAMINMSFSSCWNFY